MSSMILIPAGPFVMGLSKHEVKRISRRFDIETSLLVETMPQRVIDLPDFYIDKYPVTNAEFYAYTIDIDVEWIYNRSNPLPKDFESLPAVNVTFDMAVDYAAWAGKRLPTEEEWEKAARGRLAMLFPWGGAWNPERLSSRATGYGNLSPVNSHPMGSSPYGVMDMAGNIWEWTSTKRDTTVVIKGGSFRESRPYQFICSCKAFELGSDARDNIGFRCVKNSFQ